MSSFSILVPNYVVEVPYQRVADWIITVVEGGSIYWCDGFYLKEKPNLDTWGQPWYATPDLYKSEAAVFEVHHSGEKNVFNMADIRSALVKVAGLNKALFDRLMSDDYDAFDADILFQIAALGEEVYG